MKRLRSLGRVWVRLIIVAGMAMAAAPMWSQEAPGKTSILLGQSLALSGPLAPMATQFAKGARLLFDRVNAEGGVNGRKVNLETLDDAGSPDAALANTRKLLGQGALALFGYYGSPQVTAAYTAIKDTDVLMIAPMAAADEFRGAMYPNIYSLRPGYSEEAAAITRHAETLGVRRLAILHGADGESLAALDSAERTMTSLGANLLIKAPLDQVDKALATKPESVLVIGDPAGAAPAIKALRGKGFRGPIYGFSNTGEGLLADLLGPVGSGVILVRVVPRSATARLAIVRDLRADAAAAKAGKPTVYMLEGYIAAQVMAEALRRAGRDPNRAKLLKSIEGLRDLDLGGFRIHFGEDRVASKMVELSLIDSQGNIRE